MDGSAEMRGLAALPAASPHFQSNALLILVAHAILVLIAWVAVARQPWSVPAKIAAGIFALVVPVLGPSAVILLAVYVRLFHGGKK